MKLPELLSVKDVRSKMSGAPLVRESRMKHQQLEVVQRMHERTLTRLEALGLFVTQTRDAVTWMQRHPRPVCPGFIYVAEIEGREECVKIGYSDNPPRRFLEHAASGLHLRPALIFPALPEMERELHRLCARSHGPARELFLKTDELFGFLVWLRRGLDK